MKALLNKINIWYTNKKNGVKIISDKEYERLVKKYMNSTVIYI